VEVELMRDEMSLREIEPELGSIDAYELRADEPPFPLVIRGYDRRSVDEYLEATSARLAELEALQSPSVAVKEALERVADDTGGILKEAHEIAHGVLSRAREEAQRLVSEARREADRTVASGEARVRQMALDTDALWQERMRLIEDAQVVAASLAEIAEVAVSRFPAEEEPAAEPVESSVVVAEPLDGAAVDGALVDEPVEQPTEALDMAAIWAAEDEGAAEAVAAGAAAAEERPLPDGLDDLEPPPEFGSA
jgi:cell division septum initiation protein DivIVA